MNQEKSLVTKSIIGIAAIVALGLGVWFGINNIDQKSSEDIAKQAVIKKQVEAEQRTVVSPAAMNDVSFLLETQLQDTQGETKTVASQLTKLTLVNFWATWCAPCREEMPVFNSIHQKYQDQGFSVLGLAIDNPQGTDAFLKQLGIVYPVLMAEQEGWDLLTQTGNPKNLMPYSFLIDKNGNILEKKLGPLHAEELEGWISKNL